MACSAGSACSPRRPFIRSQLARAGAELAAGGGAGRQLAQALPARFDEGVDARLVVVERRPARPSFVDHVELDLGARAKIVAQKRRGLEREVPAPRRARLRIGADSSRARSILPVSIVIPDAPAH